ncbi:unnamed protein product [Rotaria sordida]|uniref:Uncharacterized protein n=1 Tax=Rotaria sordida TaxID=392033 RepID=A0A814MC11_9BILA|nr:unnamed protein product [Rotaria sordida]CAF1148052.1 unnamed protein product [Rotaria sordida]CAF1156850.1 unnamed protein product [Rotaria sordida]CAF4248304.1 unnamed protein product [Rotaria sordida]
MEKKAPEIANALANKVHRSTIHHWLRRYKKSGSINVKLQSGRPRTGRLRRVHLVEEHDGELIIDKHN